MNGLKTIDTEITNFRELVITTIVLIQFVRNTVEIMVIKMTEIGKTLYYPLFPLAYGN